MRNSIRQVIAVAAIVVLTGVLVSSWVVNVQVEWREPIANGAHAGVAVRRLPFDVTRRS